MQIDPQFIQTNGIQLAYHEQGDGPAFIFMHGLTANMHNFDGLMRHGLADGLRIIRMDLRGRGLSDKPATGYTMADHAADILGLMDVLGLDSVLLGGHSFGGLLTMYIAANFPQRVQKLIILDAALEATDPSVLPKIKPSLDRLGTPMPSWDVYINAIKQSPYYADGFWDDDLEAYYRADVQTLPDGQVMARANPASIEQAVRGVINEDWRTHLDNITQPVLFIHAPTGMGTGEPIVSHEGAQETIHLLPDVTYVQVSGHHITMVFGDNAPQVVKAIHEFVKS